MKKIIIYFVPFVLVLFFACAPNQKKLLYQFDEEKETILILQTIFDTIMPVFPANTNIDSIKKANQHFIVIFTNDSLIPIADTFFININKKQPKTNLTLNTPDIFKTSDTSFAELIRKIEIDTSVKAKKINIQKININNKYEILPMKESQKIKNNCFCNFKLKNLSNIVFDKTKTHACIYISYHCSFGDGQGAYYYLEKRNENWVVKKKLIGWII